MNLLKINAKNDGNVSLSVERWNHIVGRHPEMSKYLDYFDEALRDPDVIIESPRDNFIWLYHKKKGKVFIVVVIHTTREFITTAYTTDKIKKGSIRWKKD